MDEAPIVFLDSGMGGLPYLEATREFLPEKPFIYIADTAHFPYGTRSEDDIRAILAGLVERVIGRFDPAVVVVACNTGSVVALSDLRERFDVPFVGVVPAVKPAAREAGAGGIVILSTVRTADGEYLAGLIEEFAAGTPVSIVAAGALVDFVEHRFEPDRADEARAAVREAVSGIDTSASDAVVLGCTHFTHLAGEIQRELGAAVRVIDSRAGVARRVAELAAGAGRGPSGPAREGAGGHGGGPPREAGGHGGGRPREGDRGGGGRLYVTGADEGSATAATKAAAARYRALATHYGLSFEGRFE